MWPLLIALTFAETGDTGETGPDTGSEVRMCPEGGVRWDWSCHYQGAGGGEPVVGWSYACAPGSELGWVDYSSISDVGEDFEFYSAEGTWVGEVFIGSACLCEGVPVHVRSKGTIDATCIAPRRTRVPEATDRGCLGGSAAFILVGTGLLGWRRRCSCC